MKGTNILDYSQTVDSILEGASLPEFEYTVNARQRNELYYGVHSPWAVFVNNVPEKTERKERQIDEAKEPLGKDKNPAFWVNVFVLDVFCKPLYLLGIKVRSEKSQNKVYKMAFYFTSMKSTRKAPRSHECPLRRMMQARIIFDGLHISLMQTSR